MAGTGVELFLLDHTEDWMQIMPFVAIGLGLVAAVLVLVRPSRPGVRFLQVTMWGFVLSGVLGTWLHYKGNVEFELEMYPSMTGLELVWEALTGATPSLAPGLMAQLGLLGLACTYRHPRLRNS